LDRAGLKSIYLIRPLSDNRFFGQKFSFSENLDFMLDVSSAAAGFFASALSTLFHIDENAKKASESHISYSPFHCLLNAVLGRHYRNFFVICIGSDWPPIAKTTLSLARFPHLAKLFMSQCE
jgi:hypothetical protein